MKVSRTIWLVLLVLILLLAIKMFNGIDFNNNRMALIGEQAGIIHKGDAFMDEGEYDQAESTYQLALDPRYIESDMDRFQAKASLLGLYRISGEYDKAMEIVEWYLNRNPDSKKANVQRSEIEALKTYQATGQVDQVHAYIEELKETNKNILPPKGWVFGSATYISTILRLYDTIGDHDSGIAYIDMCMEYFKKVDIEKYGEYKPGHADEEFMRIREAFEQDKQDGTKGRATKGLIQSDYFPW